MYRHLLTPLVLVLALQFKVSAQTLMETVRQNEMLICSHRGVSNPEEVENSLHSLARALGQGIILHEIDLMESKDGGLFLLHDETLDRTTTLSGYIKDKDSDELKQAQLLNSEEYLPSFEQVLTWARQNNAFLMLDVKSAPLSKVMATVEDYEMLNRVVLLTFTKSRAREALDCSQEFPISVLIQNSADIDFYKEAFSNTDNLLGYVNQKADYLLFKKVKEAGIPIVSDTMGELDSDAIAQGGSAYLKFIEQKKPDILVSDYPLLVKAALAQYAF